MREHDFKFASLLAMFVSMLIRLRCKNTASLSYAALMTVLNSEGYAKVGVGFYC